MERFVFITAVTIAILFGIGAVFGGGNHFSFQIDDEGIGTAPIVETTAGQFAGEALQGSELRLRHLAAHVTITPEDRTDYLIEITSPGGTPMPTVSADEGRVIIDGQLRGRVSRCDESGGAELRGYGTVTNEQMPRITIRAPRALNVSRSGAGTTEIGASQSLDLEVSGCSSVTTADVVDELSVDLAGSANIRAGAARRLSADVAGSGEVFVANVAEGADVDIAGSGSVTIASLNGEFSADGAGSGNVAVQGGAVTLASIDLAGSGDVDIAATVQSLNVSIVGSGDVTVTNTVGELDADIAGSGGVSAQAVTGAIRQEVWGSGEVQVGQRGAQNAP